MPSPATAVWYGLAAGVLIGLALAVAGVARLVVRARALRKQLDGYADLPLWKELELAQARFELAERALSTVPSLQLRATRAFHEIEEARDRIRDSVLTLSQGAGLLLFSLVFDER